MPEQLSQLKGKSERACVCVCVLQIQASRIALCIHEEWLVVKQKKKGWGVGFYDLSFSWLITKLA